MTCNFRIVYSLRPANSIRTDRIALPHSHEQYRSKRGIFKLYQIVCIGQPSQEVVLPSLTGGREGLSCRKDRGAHPKFWKEFLRGTRSCFVGVASNVLQP